MFWLKVAFLFLAIFFTLVNTPKLIYKLSVPPGNFFWWAVGITGFIVMQWMV